MPNCHQLLQVGVLPREWPGLTIEATAPLSLTSFALSLLLVFRTNSSYARCQEARCIWGGITNRSRDIVQQVRLCSQGRILFCIIFVIVQLLQCISSLFPSESLMLYTAALLEIESVGCRQCRAERQQHAHLLRWPFVTRSLNLTKALNPTSACLNSKGWT